MVVSIGTHVRFPLMEDMLELGKDFIHMNGSLGETILASNGVSRVTTFCSGQ